MIISNGTDTSFSEDKSYAKSSVVCDYGIFERTSNPGPNDRKIDDKYYNLKLILNSSSNASLILQILDADSRNEVFKIK